MDNDTENSGYGGGDGVNDNDSGFGDAQAGIGGMGDGFGNSESGGDSFDQEFNSAIAQDAANKAGINNAGNYYSGNPGYEAALAAWGASTSAASSYGSSSMVSPSSMISSIYNDATRSGRSDVNGTYGVYSPGIVSVYENGYDNGITDREVTDNLGSLSDKYGKDTVIDSMSNYGTAYRDALSRGAAPGDGIGPVNQPHANHALAKATGLNLDNTGFQNVASVGGGLLSAASGFVAGPPASAAVNGAVQGAIGAAKVGDVYDALYGQSMTSAQKADAAATAAVPGLIGGIAGGLTSVPGASRMATQGIKGLAGNDLYTNNPAATSTQSPVTTNSAEAAQINQLKSDLNLPQNTPDAVVKAVASSRGYTPNFAFSSLPNPRR